MGEDGERYLFLSGVAPCPPDRRRAGTDGPHRARLRRLAVPRRVGHRGVRAGGPEAVPPRRLVLSGQRGRRHRRPADRPHGDRRPVAVRSHGPWENAPGNPIVRTWYGRRSVVVARARDARRGARTATGGWSTTATRTATARWAVRRCSSRSSGPRTAGPGRPAATCRRRSALPVALRRSARTAGPLSDDFDASALGRRGPSTPPARAEARPRHASTGRRCVLAGKGTGPADSSPLAVLAGDHAYEVTVTVEPVGDGAHGGLLLFFNDRAVLRHGLRRKHDDHLRGGSRSHWREPAPAAPRCCVCASSTTSTSSRSSTARTGAGWTRHDVAVRDFGLPREHVERAAQPAAGAVRGRRRDGGVPGLPLPGAPMTAELDELWEGFRSPPDEARPRAWWHWMDGNVDPEGIRLDLEWLHRGRRPRRPDVRRRHGHAAGRPGDGRARVAGVAGRGPAGRRRPPRELGLEFAVATSAGWSAAGGPWVEPADAMKKVVWSETVVDGRRRGRAGACRRCPDVAGPYQDCPRWGADPDGTGSPGTGSCSPFPPTGAQRGAPDRGHRLGAGRRLGLPHRRLASPARSRCRGTRTAVDRVASSRSSTSR